MNDLEWIYEEGIHKAQVSDFAKIWLKNRDLFIQAGFALACYDSIWYLTFKGTENKRNDIINLIV